MDNHSVEGVAPPPAAQPPLRDPEEYEDEEEEYCREYPPGVRFSPTDAELIKCYLRRRVKKRKLPCDDVIHEINLDEYHPSELLENFPPSSNGSWYFFTPRDRKYANGLRPDRAAKGGFWKATGADKQIFDDASGSRIGCRKNLVFCEGNKKQNTKTGWMMVEYCVPESRINLEKKSDNSKKRPSKQHAPEEGGMLLDTSVLCKIYHKENNRPPDSNRRECPTESVPQGNSAATPSSSAGFEPSPPPPDRSNFTVAPTHDPFTIQQSEGGLVYFHAIQMREDQHNDASLPQPSPNLFDLRAVADRFPDPSVALQASHALMEPNAMQMPQNTRLYYGVPSMQRDAPSNVQESHAIPIPIPIPGPSDYEDPRLLLQYTFLPERAYPMPTATHSQDPTLLQQETLPNIMVWNNIGDARVHGRFIQQPQSNAVHFNDSQVRRIEGNWIGPSNMQQGNPATMVPNASQQTTNQPCMTSMPLSRRCWLSYEYPSEHSAWAGTAKPDHKMGFPGNGNR